MSFGRPPSGNLGFQVTPPDRGSFPLDHFGLLKYSQYEAVRDSHNLSLRRMQKGDGNLHGVPEDEFEHFESMSVVR
jgi:hypothetical protein